MPPKGDTIRGARGGRNRGTGRDSSKSARGRNTRASDVEQSQTPTQTASRARGARGAGGSSRALPTITRGGAGRGHFPGQGGAPSTQDDDEFGDQQQYDDLLQQTQPDQGELSQEQLGQEQQDTYGQEGFGQQAQFGYHQDVFGQDVFSQQQEEQYPDPGRMSGYQYQPAIDPSLDPSLNPSLDPSLDPSPVVHTKRALPRLQHLQARTQQTQTPTRPPYSQSQSAGGLQGSGSGSMRQGLQTQSGSTNPSGRSAGSGYQSHQALQRQRPTNPGSAQRIQSGSGLHQSYSSSSLQSEGVVSPNDFIITKAKRQELRKLMEDGKTLTRKSQMKAAKAISRTPLSPGEKKDYNAKLDRVIRWNTLLIHVNLNLQDVMAFVFGERVETDSSDYEWARNKMLENCRSYKSKVCAQFKSFVEAMTTQDPTLLELSDNGFATKVGEAFTATNYFHCFFFMKNYLNVEGSSSLGKWFLKSIFVNMAVRVRKWQQIKDAREQVGDWNEVLDFFDEVALLPAHDDVDITDFQQLTQKFRNAKESKKRSLYVFLFLYLVCFAQVEY